jgi:hypothetical protein
MRQEKIQEMPSKESDKPDPYRSVVTQWLDADYHKFTEAVVRVLMAHQRPTA